MLLPLLLFIGLSLAFSVRFYTELLAQQGSVFAVGAAQLRKALSVLLSCPTGCLAVLERSPFGASESHAGLHAALRGPQDMVA